MLPFYLACAGVYLVDTLLDLPGELILIQRELFLLVVGTW
jgi:hypothetical protein